MFGSRYGFGGGGQNVNSHPIAQDDDLLEGVIHTPCNWFFGTVNDERTLFQVMHSELRGICALET